MEKNWTVGNVLSWTESYFKKNKISEARLEAEILLSAVVGCPRLDLRLKALDTLPQEMLNDFKELILRRRKRVPISYILGEQDFFGLKFLVNEHTLIPRPETEILVEEALEILKRGKGLIAADVCTGSGCIAVAVAKNSGVSKIYATDISSDALKVAYENAARHDVLSKIVLKNGDLLDALRGENIEKKLDMIISNPPYVAENEFDALEPEIKCEPKMALRGGKDGLDFYRSIVSCAAGYLKPGAHLLFEMNSNKSREIREIIENNGFTVENIVKDYSGLDRVIIGTAHG